MNRGAAVAIGLLGSILVFSGCGGSGDVLVVGSKNFTEQVILGELLAQHLERLPGVRVERRLNLASTFVCHEAARSGEIDLYVEYTGTALAAILGVEPIRDGRRTMEMLREGYLQFGLEWGRPLGFNNTFAIMVRGEDARRLNVTRLSEIGRFTPRWRAGFGYEFLERADGFRGLAEVYGLRFAAPPLELDLGLMYRALRDGQVDLIAGNSTEGLVVPLDLVILEDDLRYFPPYEAVPVVRRAALQRVAGLEEALDRLAGSISDAQMRRMNYLVDAEQADVKAVVRDFLHSAGS